MHHHLPALTQIHSVVGRSVSMSLLLAIVPVVVVVVVVVVVDIQR
jgi:high-affinity nickel permease